MAGRLVEVEAVDAFLAAPKCLIGPEPPWAPSTFRHEMQAVWPVGDEHGIAVAVLRFSCQRSATPYPAITLVFRSNPVWLIHIEDPPFSHYNPHWASEVDCPPVVHGSHHHSWADNRSHVLRSPEWDLPCRRPLHKPIKQLPSALAEFASMINLTLESDQRRLNIPPQTEMFKPEDFKR